MPKQKLRTYLFLSLLSFSLSSVCAASSSPLLSLYYWSWGSSSIKPHCHIWAAQHIYVKIEGLFSPLMKKIASKRRTSVFIVKLFTALVCLDWFACLVECICWCIFHAFLCICTNTHIHTQQNAFEKLCFYRFSLVVLSSETASHVPMNNISYYPPILLLSSVFNQNFWELNGNNVTYPRPVRGLDWPHRLKSGPGERESERGVKTWRNNTSGVRNNKLVYVEIFGVSSFKLLRLPSFLVHF